MEKQNSKWPHVYAVVRFDTPLDVTNPENSVSVVKVLRSKVVADKEATLSQTPSMVFASSRILNVNGHLSATAVPISTLADELSKEIGIPVIDKTGLQGTYDLTLEWMPRSKAGVGTASADASKQSLAEALRQVGLELKSETDRVDIFVVDHLEKPDR